MADQVKQDESVLEYNSATRIVTFHSPTLKDNGRQRESINYFDTNHKEIIYTIKEAISASRTGECEEEWCGTN